MYKRVTATGDVAIAIAKEIFKRPHDEVRKVGTKKYPRWLEPTREECMQLASFAKLQKKKERDERWKVRKPEGYPGRSSSFWMLPKS